MYMVCVEFRSCRSNCAGKMSGLKRFISSKEAWIHNRWVQYRAVNTYTVHRGRGQGFPPPTMNVAPATFKGKWKNNRTKRNP